MATNDQKAAALDALKRGVLTMAEAARRTGVTRMTVLKWCRAAEIDAVACRRAYADKTWAKLAQQAKERRSRSSL